MHPGLMSTVLGGIGSTLFQRVSGLKHASCSLALLRDGFHSQSQGAYVVVEKKGYPVLNYALNVYVWDGVRSAMASMVGAQFASGAKSV